ncbi:hypothetical protein OF83DRAFT_1057762 [Amylostereum chailletii]|nr:hypothetical protein OF83DRAFT_1057762 [Amylostereum chailletii]
MDGSTDVECHQCGALIPIDAARNHVGFHLLRALVKYPERGLAESVDPAEACGFCGFPGCSITLDQPPPARSYKTLSDCERHRRFNYHSAAKPSLRMPCTNIPMYCTLCPTDPATERPPVLWKYAMFAHLREMHPEHWDMERRCPRRLDEDMDALLAVSKDELDAIVSPRYVIPPDSPVLLPYVPGEGVDHGLGTTKGKMLSANGYAGEVRSDGGSTRVHSRYLG